jgi:hypothetical protein
MADMRFALGLVWLNPDGRVAAVLANVPPCSAQPCPLYEPDGTDASQAVLEIAASQAARLGILPALLYGKHFLSGWRTRELMAVGAPTPVAPTMRLSNTVRTGGFKKEKIEHLREASAALPKLRPFSEKVQGEWSLVCTMPNMLELYRLCV